MKTRTCNINVQELKMSSKEPKVMTITGILAPKLIQVRPIKKESTPITKRTPFKNVRLYFVEYCQASTIHGVRYIGENGLHFIEKLLWTIIVTVLCTGCLFSIHKAYVKWEESPVTVTFAAKETPIYKIPFPAVTICPEVQFDPEIFNFTDLHLRQQNGMHLTSKEAKYLQLSYMICSGAVESGDMFDRSNLNASFGTDISQLLEIMTPPFDPLNVATVQWLGELGNIDTFDPMLTSEGICLTFNMLAEEEILRYSDALTNSSRPSSKSHKWSLEKGYPSGDNFDAFPRRTFIPGLEGGLTIDSIYTNNSHLDPFCKGSLHGFKVTLHHPCELPNMEKYFRLPLNEALFVGIKPSLIMVSDELLNYPPKIRKCYFENEKYLSSYNIYTQQNCLDECLANYTVKQCACVPFYLARSDEETIICGFAKMDCAKRSKLKYLEMESRSNKSGGERCDCLPSCTSLTYDVELSQTDWSWGKTYYAVKKYLENKTELNPNNTHLSYLSVYYKDLQFLSSERKELYGSLEFFSNTGGLLGLFFGFSIISLIELVHFLTVRILCNIRMYGRNAWSGHFN